MKCLVIRTVLGLTALLLLLLLVVMAGYVYQSTRTDGRVMSSGEDRNYLIHLPPGYDPATPVPLVISLHGAFLYPGFQMRLAQWNALADREGFIVVYPKASGFPPLWRLEPGDDLSTEIRFFSDLIDVLSDAYNIDADRIYADGFSNGAAMSSMLACNLPHRIAAFGMVATPVLPWDWCQSASPAPVIVIHGTEDPLTPYRGGENFLTTGPLLSLPEWVALWAERNRCNPAPIDTARGEQVDLRQYMGCQQDASVVLYSVKDAGHVWPGGRKFPGDFTGPDSDSIDATAEIWAFFRQHSLAR